MATTEYWQRGESIDYTNTGSAAIKYGSVVSLGERIGVAGCDIPVNATGSLHVFGVFIMPKAAEAFAIGDAVYWDATAENITATETGNTSAGWVVEAAATVETPPAATVETPPAATVETPPTTIPEVAPGPPGIVEGGSGAEGIMPGRDSRVKGKKGNR